MARIEITCAVVSSANQLLRKTACELAQLRDAYASLDSYIDSEIQSRYQIAERLRACHQAADEIHQMTGRILDVAESGLLGYRITEARLKRAALNDGMLEMSLQIKSQPLK